MVPAAQWRAHADQLVLGWGRDESQAEPGWTLPPTPPGSGVGSVCQRLSRRPQEHWPGRAGGGERFPRFASWCVSERWATERRGPQAATWPPTPPGPEEGRGRGGPQALAGKATGSRDKRRTCRGPCGPLSGPALPGPAWAETLPSAFLPPGHQAGRAWLAGQGGGEAPAPRGLRGAGHLACGGLGCEPRAPMTSPRGLLPRRPPSARRVGKLRLGHSAGPAGAPELCSRGWGGQCREVADLAHPRGPREHAGGVGGDRAGPDRGVIQSRPPHPTFYVTYDACASVNDHEEGAGRGPTSVVGWGAGGSHPEGPPTGLGSAHRPQAVVSICGASGSRCVRRARVTHGQPRLPG